MQLEGKYQSEHIPKLISLLYSHLKIVVKVYIL